MTVTVTVDTKGFAEIERQLNVLREQFNVKTGGILLRGLQAGANLIRDEARSRAPQRDPRGFTGLAAALTQQIARTTDKRKRQKIQRAITRALALTRSNIVAYKISASHPLAGGIPSVIVRVRNRGWSRLTFSRRGGRAPIGFNSPGTSPGYWWWIEFGTSRFPARPFMRPAFNAQAQNAIDVTRKYLQIEIAKQFGTAFKKAA
jgi:HK97 gp10 family phage protein